MARPSAPTKLKLLGGETRPSRINYGEPVPRAAPPEPPAGAPEVVLVEWRRVVAELTAMGIAYSADRDTIYAYCAAVTEHQAALNALVRDGVVVPGQRGPIKNPACQIVRDAATTLRLLARELGLTPSSRASLRLGDRDKREHAARILDG